MIQIVVDVRENGILQKLEFAKVEFSKKQLPLGDILLVKNENTTDDQHDDEILVYIERKTLQDLLSSIKDGRYDEQSFRLANTIQGEVPRHRVIYIIEGFFSTLSLQEKNLVLSAMTSIQLFKGFSVWRTSSLQETVDVIIAMAGKIERDLKKGKTMYQEVAIPTIVSDNADQDQTENSNQNTNTNPNTNNPNPQYSSVVKKVKKNNY
jgi:ERCC4-type nuclease